MKELKCASDFTDEVMEILYPPEGKQMGYRAPWEQSSGKILFKHHQLSVWTGFSGHGKSQFLRQIMLSMIQQGAKVCVASLELDPENYLKGFNQQAALMTLNGKCMQKPNDWYEDKLFILNPEDTASSQQLLDAFEYGYRRYGIDVFLVDPFVISDMSEHQFVLALHQFTHRYNCQIHIIIQTMKGVDESKPPSRLVHKGTGVTADLADNCFSVWRNRQKELILQKQQEGLPLSANELEKLKDPDCVLLCDKQRNGSWEGSLGFWFDSVSYQYLECEDQLPTGRLLWNNQSSIEMDKIDWI